MLKKSKLLEKVKTSVESNRLVLPQDGETARAELEGTKRLRNAKIIPIAKIKPDPEQPRRVFDPLKLQELADSIKKRGIQQPISVEFFENKDGGYYKIISGERRYKASKLIGLEEMPCIILNNVSSEDRFALQLIENIQREDLSPIDKALALLKFKEHLGPETVWADVEKAVSISEKMRKNYVALLDLPETIQKEIVATGSKPSKNQVTEKHARALLLLKSFPEKQQELFEKIKDSQDSISGDQALVEARNIKGTSSIHHFSLSYKTESELLEKLINKVAELKKMLNIQE